MVDKLLLGASKECVLKRENINSCKINYNLSTSLVKVGHVLVGDPILNLLFGTRIRWFFGWSDMIIQTHPNILEKTLVPSILHMDFHTD